MSACIMTDSVFFNSILDIRRYPSVCRFSHMTFSYTIVSSNGIIIANHSTRNLNLDIHGYPETDCDHRSFGLCKTKHAISNTNEKEPCCRTFGSRIEPN